MPTAEAEREITLTLPRLHSHQRMIKQGSRRFTVVNTGRRYGKTTLGIDVAIRVLLEGGNVGWFAPVYKLIAGEDGMWPHLTDLLPRELIAHIDNSENTLALITGGKLECWSLEKPGSENRFRGREYDVVIVDEAAYIPQLERKFEKAIGPTLVDREGSAWFFSTPNGYNDFWELYQRGEDPNTWPDWASFEAPSNARPSFPAAEWERLKAQGDPAFPQEYMAQFQAPQGLVLGMDSDGVSIFEPEENFTTPPAKWADCKWRVASIDPGGQDPFGFSATGFVDAGGPRPRPLMLPKGQHGPRLLGPRETFMRDRAHVYYAERRTGNVGIEDIHAWLLALNDLAPWTRIVVGETGGETIVNSLQRLGWRQTVGFVKDRSVSIPLIRSMSKARLLTFGRSCQSVFAPYERIDMEKLIKGEVYTWMFDEREPGTVGRTTWNTIVNTSGHHADVLDAVKDGLASVHVSYPGFATQRTGRAADGGGQRAV